MTHHLHTYLPAAGRDWALPFYDTITRVFGIDRARGRMLADADLGAGQRILDVGCGTGTFAVLIKTSHLDAEVVGLDPDSKALRRAMQKAERASVRIAFDRGFATELPYADGSFDRVISSFMFHHLPLDQKPAALQEFHRVLGPGGALHLIDFGGPDSGARGVRGWLLRTHKHTRDNFGERIPSRLEEAGFAGVRLVSQRMLIAGPVAYYRAEAR
jgi:ubiquinone/menaquinone biosynthesis C-methylase UbiE